MPIMGVTDRTGFFMEIGRIHKGDEKKPNAPGGNLKHFRVTFRPDEKEAAQLFEAVYGKEPRMINVRLPYPDVARVWDAYYEAYVKGGMVAQATGDVKDGGRWRYYLDYETQEVCIRDYVARNEQGESLIAEGPHIEKAVCRTNSGEIFLKQNGKLNVVVPELNRVAHLTLVTTSIHDIFTLSDELRGAQEIARQVNKTLCDIPFVLLRRPEMITKPVNGKRVKVEESLCHLTPTGEWTHLAMKQWNRLALADVVEGETRMIEGGQRVSNESESWEDEQESTTAEPAEGDEYQKLLGDWADLCERAEAVKFPPPALPDGIDQSTLFIWYKSLEKSVKDLERKAGK